MPDMSMVSVTLDDVKDLDADWIPNGPGFIITALGGQDDRLYDRVSIILNDEQVTELRRALSRVKPDRAR